MGSLLLEELFMKGLAVSRFFTAMAAGICLLGIASAAQARSDVYFSVGIAGAPAAYVAPAPVYVQPAPVFVQPAPVYVQPTPTYVYPRPVYVQPPPSYAWPSRVYIQPDYSVDEERERRRDEWRRRQWRHHYWRHQHGWYD